jgi:hypothetical protein
MSSNGLTSSTNTNKEMSNERWCGSACEYLENIWMLDMIIPALNILITLVSFNLLIVA